MENKITVTLCDDSPVFIYSDILSCGRAARGEKFAYRYYHSLVTIYEKEALTFRDNTRYQPEHMDMDGIGLYEGETHLLSMVICNLELDNEIAGFFENYGKPYGITKNDKGYIIIKALGNSAQKLQEISDKIKEFCYGVYKNTGNK
jgi:urease accessory protein